MPLKQVNSDYDFISLASDNNKITEQIDVSISIELPLSDNEAINYKNCIVAYFDYDYSNPFSDRDYKLFKYYDKITRSQVESDFVGLDKIQGIYIILNQEETTALKHLEILNRRHLTI
jgi:hypothetical protein